MEIRRWLYYVVNCALVCYIVAKPFSLNKLIESESNQKEVSHTTQLPKKEIEESEPAAERFSLNKGLKPLNRISKKIKETETKLNLIPLSKKISPLKYRKAFQIKSPLKPKRVKTSLRTRHKRKNQSIKQGIDGNAILNKKYVPLLRSLGMLFDNILGTDSRESFEERKHKKRLRYFPDGDDDVPCKCPRQRASHSEPESEEETVTFTEAIAPEAAFTTKAAAETTNNPSAGNLRSFRRHKNVPLLLSRNTAGAWRNNHGISERGRAAHNGSVERYISGNNGVSEHIPKRGQEQSNEESDEGYTSSDSRNNASRFRARGALRGREYRNNTEVFENEATSKDEAENFLESREDTTQHNEPYKLEAKRDKAKSGKLLSEPIRRQREFLSNDEVIDFAESVQSEENHKESIVGVTHYSTSGERLSDRDGPHSSENKKISSRTKTITTYDLPVVVNRYSTIATKTTRIKDNFSISDKNNDNESNGSISQDNSKRSLDTDDSNAQETNKSFETELQKEPLFEQSHEIKVIKKMSKSARTIDIEHKEENDDSKDGTEWHGSTDQLYGDSTYSKPQTSARPDSVHKSPKVEMSQYLPETKSSRSPVVMIIDGYSVTRHKNGENKLAEKAIRIRP